MGAEFLQSLDADLRDALTPEARARIKPLANDMGAAIAKFCEAFMLEADPASELFASFAAIRKLIEGGAIDGFLNDLDDVVLSANEING
jgi:hypothetical protein